MSTGNVSAHECPRCASTNTILVERGRTCDSWHCYACGHSFDVGLTGSIHVERRKGTDRRQNADAWRRRTN